MRNFDLNSIENINEWLKAVFSDIAAQTLSPLPVPPEAIPQLDQKDERPIALDEKDTPTSDRKEQDSDSDDDDDDQDAKHEKKSDKRAEWLIKWERELKQKKKLMDATKALMDAENPLFTKTNKALLLDGIQALLKKYESINKSQSADSKQVNVDDGFELLTHDDGFSLFIEIYGRSDADYRAALEGFLKAAKQLNDVMTISFISGLLDVEVEPAIKEAMDKIRINKSTTKTISMLKANGIQLDEKEIATLKSMIEKLEWPSKLKDALLEMGFEFKEYAPEQLLAAALQNHDSQVDISIAKFLIQHGVKAKTPERELELLTTALKEGPKELQLVLEQITDINAQDSEGNSAIMQVMKRDIHDALSSPVFPNYPRLMAFSMLIDKGANINLRNNKGNTALIVAATYLAANHIGYILEHKDLDIDASNAQGQTALLAAVITNFDRPKNEEDCYFFTGILKALIKKGANIDAKDNNGDNALLLAVKAKDKKMIGILLNHGANPDVSDKNGKTAIQWAIELGLKDVAINLEKYKLKKKEESKQEESKQDDEKKHDNSLDNPHSKFFSGALPERASMNVMRFLASLEMPPQTRTSKPYKAMIKTLVHDDAADRLSHLIAVLKDLNIPVDRATLPTDTEEAFKQLVDQKKKNIRYKIVGILYKKPKEIDKDDLNLLFKRLSTLGIEIDPNTLEEKKDAETTETTKPEKKSTAILFPAHAFKTLFEKYQDKLNVDSTDTLLLDLRERQITEILKISCKGASCQEDRKSLESLLNIAIEKNQLGAAIILLDEGVNPNLIYEDLSGRDENRRLSLLHYAVSRHNLELVKILLAHKANINAVDAEGRTPLMRATDLFMVWQANDALTNWEIIQLLIQKAAKIDVKDQKGETAVSYAINNGRSSVVTELVAAAKRTGINPGLDGVNESGQTPLLAVIQKEFDEKKRRIEKGYAGEKDFTDLFPKLYVKVLRTLFKYEINVNAQDRNGCTALMLAVVNKEVDLAAFLLNKGANPCIPDAKGQTPLAQAQANAQPEMIELLQKAILAQPSASSSGRTDAPSVKSMIFAKVDEAGAATQSSTTSEHNVEHKEAKQANKDDQVAGASL